MERAAVVTGAGTGIGRATAQRLAGRGLHVYCIGRTAATLEEAVTSIRAAGGTGAAVVADCGTASGLAAIAAAVSGSPIAALVHAAGADLIKPFATTTRSEFDRLIDVNLAAPFFLTQAVLPALVDGAGVVFVGSISASRGRNRHAAYGAAKAALVGLTVNLAAELAPRIRVNCVSPGATRSGMLDAYLAETRGYLSPDERNNQAIADWARLLLGRIAEPDEVAASVVHLAVDATAATGIDLAIDVGYGAS